MADIPHDKPSAGPRFAAKQGCDRPRVLSATTCLHGEIVCLHQILKMENRSEWISAVLDMSAPYAVDVGHRVLEQVQTWRRS